MAAKAHREGLRVRTVAIRVPVEEAAKIRARLSRRSDRNKGVQRKDSIVGGWADLERGTIFQAALWLKNRLAEQQGK